MTSRVPADVVARSAGRGIALHLVARAVMPTILGLVGATVPASVSAQWLAARPMFDGADARAPVAVGLPLLVAVLAAGTLAGADVELEAATPRCRRRTRMWHLISVVVLGCLSCVAALHTEPTSYGAVTAIRTLAGCVGMTALASTILGARAAWWPVTAYVMVVYLGGGAGRGTDPRGWWAWPVEPTSNVWAWCAGAALAVVGTVVYVRRGPAHHR